MIFKSNKYLNKVSYRIPLLSYKLIHSERRAATGHAGSTPNNLLRSRFVDLQHFNYWVSINSPYKTIS